MDNPILKKGEPYSKPFRARHCKVLLEGIPCDTWGIECRRRNDEKAQWQPEQTLSAETRQTDLHGCKELEYRISMNVPDCVGFVFEYAKL